MKIFLTGVTGFVGSHLARLILQQRHEVHALIRSKESRERIGDIASRLRIIDGDLFESELWIRSIEKIKPEMAVHLAWITTPGVYLKSPENLDLVDGSLRLAKSLADAGCKTIAAVGTCFEYDTDHSTLAETTPTRPKTLYAASKLALETVLEQFAKTAGIRFLWPRLFYLYGPWEDKRRLVPTLIRSHLSGQSVKLTSGEKVRDYLHVEDVASAIWAAAKSDLAGPVNVGSGRPVTLRELAEKISELTKTPGLLKFDAMPDDPSDPKHILADNRRLLQTGWKPKHTLEQGLRKTIEWWKGRA